MFVETQVSIDASRPAIWAVITDIENASMIFSGIESIEILERPATGLKGLKWRETRMLFGKPAAAVKLITDVVENESYETRSESNGFLFVTTLRLSGSGDSITLTSTHDSRPQGVLAWLQSIPMALFFKGVARKAILQDLNDVRSAVEGG